MYYYSIRVYVISGLLCFSIEHSPYLSNESSTKRKKNSLHTNDVVAKLKHKNVCVCVCVVSIALVLCMTEIQFQLEVMA